MEKLRYGIYRLQNVKLSKNNLCHTMRHVSSKEMYTDNVSSTIEKKLNEHFSPVHLQVVNESHMHNVPKNSETHFKVVVISSKFINTSLLERHRMINKVLSEEVNKIHALSIVATTPSNWFEGEQKVGRSPPCKGGSQI